ncbi:MAG: response regulator [Thioploca sp.]|nr:response regulator [Thioploca sp.]
MRYNNHRNEQLAILQKKQTDLEQQAAQPPILLVDDREDNLFTLEKILRRQNYNLIAVKSGEAALQWVLSEPNCALIILDVEMPGMNGLETAKRIREQHSNPNLPIIFITGFTQNLEKILEGYALGAIDFIPKPFNHLIIKAKVAVLVDLHRKTLALKQANIRLQLEILERQQAEEHIQFQRRILKQIRDPVIVVDNDNCIIYLNSAAMIQYHCNNNDIIGQPLTNLYQVQWLHTEEAITNEELNQTGFWHGECVHLKNNGETRCILLTVSILTDIHNKKIGLIIIPHDITTRKQMEMALAASRASFRHLVELNPIGIMVLDHQNIIVFINQAMQKFLINQGVFKVGEVFTSSLTNGQRQEMDIVRVSGESGTAEMELVDTYWEDSPAYLVMLHDITERQRVEQALQIERSTLAQRVEERTIELRVANAELARASRLKDEFLANMSHELRTPLNSVLGNVEMLQEQIFGLLTAKQQEIIQRIGNSGKHLLRLINDILDLSKICAGQLELSISQVVVDPICQDSLQFVQQAAQKKRIKLRFSCDYQIYIIKTDELRLKQILVNLLTNAVKFTSEGGQVELAVNADVEHQSVEFVVRDTGIGIHKADLNKLFKPFIQLDATLNRQQEGTGLGLSLVSKLTELLGGSVTVTSEIGQGSCFIVTLPWHPDEKRDQFVHSSWESIPKTTSIQKITIRHSIPRILLAEDSEATQEMLFNYLVAKKYQVLLAHDGIEAIEKAKRERPDLILMDIQMPKIDGLEAIRCLRIDPILVVTPIIALTALVMAGDRERCLNAGANAYLSKPINLKQLLETIESLLPTELNYAKLINANSV